MTTFRCASCGRDIEPAPRCPHCGAEQGQWADELVRIERSIAEMKARDAEIGKERQQIASRIQAALFQRDILAHANDEKLKQATKPRRLRRNAGRQRPPTAASGPPQRNAPGTAPPRIPRQGGGGRDRVAPPPPAPPRRGPDRPAGPEHAPEASPREVQNVLLGLGALLLGVAAVVFAVVAIASFGDLSRVAILTAATALMLVAAPMVARRGLTSTAETIAAVGLLLVPLDGYAVWTVHQISSSGVSGAVFASVTLLVTALIAGGYAGATGLAVPRYATVLALQPVIPLLAYPWISGPAAWALVLTAVAAIDLVLGRLFTQDGRLVLTPWLARRPGPAIEDDLPPVGDPGRPETAGEEADAVLIGPETDQRRRSDEFAAEPAPVDPAAAGTARSTFWLRELTWALHGLTVAAALVYAVVALVDAAAVPVAVRAASALLLAAAVALAGALSLGRPTARDLAAGVMTLAVIGAVGRVAAVALPGRALLLIAAVIALTGLGVRAVPEHARRGPQLASAVALSVIGVVVAGDAIRAALAPIRAALPPWAADLGAYPDRLAASVGSATWQLATAAFLLTVAAALALPPDLRREFAVVGAALTALAAPASFGLPWAAAPWPPVLAAIAIGLLGLSADSERGARTHAGVAAVVGLAGAAMAVSRPSLTAAVLSVLAIAGILIALAPTVPTAILGRTATVVADWAGGGAAFAVPGAVAAFVAAAVPLGPEPTTEALNRASLTVLAASFLAVCATVGYAAVAQVAHRHISLPLTIGSGLGTLAVTVAAFAAPGATLADALVGTLLMAAAVLLFLAPSIDAGRRADRIMDGPDYAAAAATAGLVGALARIAAILVPGAELAAAAGLLLVVAAGVRAMPVDWRRGPALGIIAGGGVVGLIAGYTALTGGIRVLATPGSLWAGDLNAWPTGAPGAHAWQAPLALLLLAGAAAMALPRPWGYDVAGVCVWLATIGTPAALGLPWWSPILVGGVVATVYGLAAVAAADPRAGLARTAVAAAVALHAVGAGLVRPWSTAAALGLVTLLGIVVAALARIVAAPPDRPPADESGVDPMPVHLAQIGGLATGAALLALPGALAALAAQLGWPAEIVLSSALGGSSLGVATLGLIRRRVPHYLPYATVGIAGGATATAIAAVPSDVPAGVYAAAAALLGVMAELLRAATPPPGRGAVPVGRWSAMLGGALRWSPESAWGRRSPESAWGRWSVSPVAGALAVAAVPTLLALAALGPALVAALVEPYVVLSRIWQGPPPELVTPPPEAVNGTNVLTALLLTIAAALAATGFSGGRPARAVPVVLPGAAITLLITPISLGQGWPNPTMAALVVFTISMLGLALTPPPPVSERSRSLRVARILVFVIGQAAGGAGLAGSLATRPLTLFTLGSAVGVGGAAALAGRTQRARILGWLFASVMAQLFVLTLALVTGLDPGWSAFGVLAVGAVLLVIAATLPRLRRPEAVREAATVEWTGYGSALIALALAYQSPRHIAGLLAAWGAVVGVAATRPGRRAVERRVLFWSAVACEMSAWWLLMWISHVGLLEAYTLPFAALALLVGVLELRHHPEMSSWLAYGPALLAAFLPTLAIVLTTNTSSVRQVLLLLGAVAVLIVGSITRQQAQVVVGAVVTAIAALHALTMYGPWLVLIPVGVVLLVLGASNERRRRTQERLRGALRGMR